MTVGPNRVGEFKTHWRALAGCTLAASIGTIGLQAYTGGAFFAALTGDGVFTRTQLSFATFLLSATVAVAAPIAGTAMDRFGALRVIGLAIVGEAIGFTLLGASAAYGLAAFAAATAILGLLGVGTTPPGFARIVTARFDRGRGLALGMMISGLGLMAMSGPIWANWLIGQVGWRTAYFCLSLIVLVLGGVGALLIRSDLKRVPAPAGGHRHVGGDWHALRKPIFWAIFAGFIAPALFGGGYLLHMISLLHERGFSTASAAKVQSLIGLAVLTGRLCSGAALDRFRAQYVAAVAFVISALGCLILLTSTPALIAVAALAIGLTIGAELDILAYMISRYFGLASFARLYALAYAGLIVAGGLSPLMISLIAERGGYSLALVISAVGILIGVLVLLLLPLAPQSAAEEEPA